jgi:hypothetical protein
MWRATRKQEEHDDATPAVPLKPRATLTDEHERDDVRQVIAILLAAIQRERARADQFYTRARNLLAYTTALFTGIQAAFLVNLGRANTRGVPFITPSEREQVAWAAVLGLGFLVVGAILLFVFADRARRVEVTTADQVFEALFDPNHRFSDTPVLVTLAAQLGSEQESWAEANQARGHLNLGLAVICLIASGIALVELVFLYSALA